MIRHSAISLDYLEDRVSKGANIRIKDAETGKVGSLQTFTLRRWRSQGYSFAPPCDNVLPNGRCAGHEEEGNEP